MSKREWPIGALALLLCASFGDPVASPKLVKGVVLNAADRTPLPEYTLVIESTADPLSTTPGSSRLQMERPTTDSAGRFTSAMPFPIRTLAITAIDWDSTDFIARRGGVLLAAWATPRGPSGSSGAVTDDGHFQARVPFKGEPLEILMPCGPTFDLVFKPFEIRTDGPALGASVVRLIAVTEGDVDEGVAMTTRVRTLDPMRGWARFAALPGSFFAKPHRALLEVVAADGRWKATADVTEHLASGTRAVDLEWKACSRWSGTLRGIRTTSLAANWISAERMSDDDRVLERRRLQVELDGNFRFLGLEPGRWRVTTRPLRTKPFISDVRQLDFEKQVAEPINLERIETKLALRGSVRGGAHSKDAAVPPAGRLVLRRANEELPFSEIWLSWIVVEERYVATFEFTELPEGEFDVDLVTPYGALDENYEKSSLRARSGGSAIEFVRQ